MVNPNSLGEGSNDLIICKNMLFYDLDFRFISHVQALGRCHRMGSERHDNINLIYIVCENTVEMMVYKLIQKKMEDSKQLLSKQKEITESEIINEYEQFRGIHQQCG